MSFEIISKTTKSFKIKIKNTDISKVINIRKLIYTNIKTYAPFLVIFYANDNNLTLKCTDIAHRIGLIILQNSLLSKIYKQGIYYRCKLEHTAKEDFEDVWSDNIELLDQYNKPTGIFPFIEGFFITQLLKNQTLHLDIIINKDTSNKHLKYRPGNVTSFKEIDNNTFILDIDSFGILDIDNFYNKIIKYTKKLI